MGAADGAWEAGRPCAQSWLYCCWGDPAKSFVLSEACGCHGYWSCRYLIYRRLRLARLGASEPCLPALCPAGAAQVARTQWTHLLPPDREAPKKGMLCCPPLGRGLTQHADHPGVLQHRGPAGSLHCHPHVPRVPKPRRHRVLQGEPGLRARAEVRAGLESWPRGRSAVQGRAKNTHSARSH